MAGESRITVSPESAEPLLRLLGGLPSLRASLPSLSPLLPSLLSSLPSLSLLLPSLRASLPSLSATSPSLPCSSVGLCCLLMRPAMALELLAGAPTVLEAAVSVPKVYVCQLPYSSLKQCTAPVVVS